MLTHLSNNNLVTFKMPQISGSMIYGTAWKAERTTKLVYQALQAGFRGIDTAAQPRHYQGQYRT